MAQARLRTQNVTRAVLQEIIQQAASVGNTVSLELVAFMVRVALLNPENDFTLDGAQPKYEIARLIEMVVGQLTEPTIFLETLKLQLFFDMNYDTREQFKEEHERLLDVRVNPRMQSLVNCRPRTREDLQEMFLDIAKFIIIWSDLGTARDTATVKETSAALRSVFPQAEIGHFLGMDKNDKKRQLHELKEIVTGIRLFNKDCRKGGESIPNLREKLPVTMANVLETVEERLAVSRRHASIALSVLTGESKTSYDEKLKRLMWDIHVNAQQEVMYLRTIKEDVMRTEEDAAGLLQKFELHLSDLHASVEAHVAIPTVHVYPRFIRLALVWKELHQLMVIVNLLENIVHGFGEYTQCRNIIVEEHKDQSLLITSDAVIREEEINQYYKPGPFMDVEIPSSDNIKKLGATNYAYQGFCPVALVEQELLIQGCRQRGIALYQGRYFACSTVEALRKFAEKPDWYEDNIITYAKRLPELIHLLQLNAEMFGAHHKLADKLAENLKQTSSTAVQTDIHPVEENIVPSYEWNEWELRRKALLLANLQNKLTHSTQTDHSHMRRENSTQVFLPKNTSCQSLVETGINTINDHHFLFGLQGYRKGRPAKFKYIDFTQLDSLLPGH